MRPYVFDQGHVEAGANYVTQRVVTAGAVDTKGAYQTVISSAPFDITELVIAFDGIGAGGTERSQLIDIALDPSGTPNIIIADLQASYWFDAETAYPRLHLPIFIPAGSEVGIRWQSTTGSLGVFFIVAAYGGGQTSFRSTDTYGTVSTGSKGTTLATPGAVDTFGAWTEIVASTTNDIYALGVGLGVDWGPGLTTSHYAVDIGVGAAASEEVIIPDLNFETTTSEIIFNLFPAVQPVMYLPEIIPAGSRIAARFKYSVAFTVANVSLIGFTDPYGFRSHRNLASNRTRVGQLVG